MSSRVSLLNQWWWGFKVVSVLGSSGLCVVKQSAAVMWRPRQEKNLKSSFSASRCCRWLQECVWWMLVYEPEAQFYGQKVTYGCFKLSIYLSKRNKNSSFKHFLCYFCLSWTVTFFSFYFFAITLTLRFGGCVDWKCPSTVCKGHSPSLKAKCPADRMTGIYPTVKMWALC